MTYFIYCHIYVYLLHALNQRHSIVFVAGNTEVEEEEGDGELDITGLDDDELDSVSAA